MTPERTIEKKGDTGVQDKDEKTAQGGAMTRQQAEQEMEQLRKVFPSVRMLTAEQVQAGEAVGDAARQALEEKTTHSRMEYRGQELYEVTALLRRWKARPACWSWSAGWTGSCCWTPKKANSCSTTLRSTVENCTAMR